MKPKHFFGPRNRVHEAPLLGDEEEEEEEWLVRLLELLHDQFLLPVVAELV